MYTGHQRSLGINRQGNGAGNHNHHPSGNGKNRSIGNNGSCGGNNSRFTGNTKMNTSSNPSGSSSGNSSISSNTSSNNGTNQSPTSSVSGPSIKNKGHSDSNWNQYCQEWNQYVVKGRQHGRESNSHNATPHIHNNNSNTGLPGNNGMPPGADKRNSSINASVQGPVKPEVTGVTHKDNYQTIDGEKKINSGSWNLNLIQFTIDIHHAVFYLLRVLLIPQIVFSLLSYQYSCCFVNLVIRSSLNHFSVLSSYSPSYLYFS